MNDLKLENDTLIPITNKLRKNMQFTSGGLTKIVLSEYDTIFLYGLGFRLPRLNRRLSRAVIQQSFKDRLLSSLVYGLVQKVRRATALPIYVGHPPQLAKGDDDDSAAMLLGYSEMIDEINAVMDIANVKIVKQPQATLVSNWYTKAQFAKGSRRLATSEARANEFHEDGERGHVNGEFGTLYLGDLFQLLEADGVTNGSTPQLVPHGAGGR